MQTVVTFDSSSHLQFEFGHSSMHLLEDVHQPAVGMTDILSKTENSHDYLVCIPAVALLNR
jgi:hypothetical protein